MIVAGIAVAGGLAYLVGAGIAWEMAQASAKSCREERIAIAAAWPLAAVTLALWYVLTKPFDAGRALVQRRKQTALPSARIIERHRRSA